MRTKSRNILLTLLVAAFALPAFAQESLPENTGTAEQEPVANERIVEGRPKLYTFKHWAHPLTWVEEGLQPVAGLADNSRIRSLLNRKPGTVQFGIGSLGTGSGFGPKVTFARKNLLGRGIEIEVPLVYTYSRYQQYEFKSKIPLISTSYVERLWFDVDASYGSRAKDGFFGLGNDSLQDDRSQFRMVTRQASVGLSAVLDEGWSSGLHAVYRRVGITKPTIGPTVQERFDSESTPGLSGAALSSMVFSLAHDTSRVDDFAFRGGTDKFEISFNKSAPGQHFEYWKYRLDSTHVFPLTSDGRKAIAATGLIESNQPTSGNGVPFFDMPMIGSGQTLRGFDNFRFRDKNALLLSLEYRYRIWPALDFGLFVDEGQVAPRLGDLAWNGFHTGYGTRLFIWPKKNLPISIDYGRSNEKWRVYFNFGKTF